jgi:hypothetical protein
MAVPSFSELTHQGLRPPHYSLPQPLGGEGGACAERFELRSSDLTLPGSKEKPPASTASITSTMRVAAGLHRPLPDRRLA